MVAILLFAWEFCGMFLAFRMLVYVQDKYLKIKPTCRLFISDIDEC